MAVREQADSRSEFGVNDNDVAKHLAGKLEIVSVEPGELVRKLTKEGAQHVYVDGGNTIQRFLRAGLIDELIVSRMPVLLGSGIPLFGEVDADMQFEHVKTLSFPSGLVQSRYRLNVTGQSRHPGRAQS